MIVPMKKVSLIIPENKKNDTLKKLRKLGVVHIKISEGSGEKLSKLKSSVSLLEYGISAVGDMAKGGNPQKNVTVSEALDAANEIVLAEEEKKKCSQELLSYKAELERIKWLGDINPEEFTELSEKGIDVSVYDMPASEYDKLNETLKIVVLGKTKYNVCFMAVKSKDENSHLADAYKISLPKESTKAIREKISGLEKQLEEIESKFVQAAEYTESMKKAISDIDKEIEFEIYSSGMADENLSEAADFKVAYFTGYVEAENEGKLKETAKSNSWGLLIQEPAEEDDVPTKLKNNRFVSLIYPLTDFLGTVPGYFEYDISGWFLGFILIFFGIIFGDGGYGLFICAVLAIPIIKSLKEGKGVQPVFLLIGLFGLSTILWGLLTCTWFGLSPERLPVWLKSLSVPVISNVYADKIWYPFWSDGSAGLTTTQNLQILFFSIALIQLVAAHAMCMARNRGSLKMLGDFGSILQLIGVYYVVLSLVVNGDVFGFGLVIGGIPVGTTAISLVGIGFVMSFAFSNYEGSVIKSVVAGLKDIVSMLLGVVNVFSDIVSYIRLWAVGLAGAAISATVNELAGPLFGNFLFMIFAIIILVFGHGLNMILNVLSIVVHGIRLNTLEFSSHLGMSWSGHKFKPFEE